MTPHLRLLLIALPLALPACDYACVMFCTNPARIQREYEGSRDLCRDVAELKMEQISEEGPGPGGSGRTAEGVKNNKTRLVGLFSDCMNTQGWLVPGPAEDKAAEEKTPAPVQPSPTAQAGLAPLPAPVPEEVKRAQLKRDAECAFARQAANNSVIARKRAQACDLECREATRRAPDAPKHPSCP